MLKDFILEGSVDSRDVVDYLVHVKVCGEFALYYLEDSSALVCQVRDKHAAGWAYRVSYGSDDVGLAVLWPVLWG